MKRSDAIRLADWLRMHKDKITSMTVGEIATAGKEALRLSEPIPTSTVRELARDLGLEYKKRTGGFPAGQRDAIKVLFEEMAYVLEKHQLSPSTNFVEVFERVTGQAWAYGEERATSPGLFHKGSARSRLPVS